jgi:predicted alpha/beta hydrolase family esterase
VASSNDAMCSLAKAQQYAQAWGSNWVPYGERGHINGESGLGDWDEGHAMLLELLKSKKEN